MPGNVASSYVINAKQTAYYPPLIINEFWMIRDVLRPMNETVVEVTVEMSFRPVSINRWSMFKSVEGMWETQLKMGSMRESEPDDLKRMFIETNVYLLATTIIVSLLHSVFEVLAFKNDIKHWRSVKSMEGVSVRTMFWQIGMQIIIFLYLWDNETSWMITIGNGMGIVIEVWKLRKAVKVKSFGVRKLLGFIPWIEIQHDEDYSNKTKELDDEAMRYMSYILYPSVALYAAYTLKYEVHKSWYSWAISSLVGAVYAGGFLLLFPQVIINYRLKSVAHMPMKSFMYKALNTVVDDLFSFVIKMPMLHRLACFRDDFVFAIYLYQMWAYKVDKTRANEFGQRLIDAGEEKEKTDSAAPKTVTQKKED
jgi:hypothetical protein